MSAPRQHAARPSTDETSSPEGPSRRRFLGAAACALGGGVTAAVAIPTLRMLTAPATQRVVVRPSTPIDIGSIDMVPIDAAPLRVAVVAPLVRDAWTAARDVPLGSAWLQRPTADRIVALSAVCPHLGCAIGWDPAHSKFSCPCHESFFAPDGRRELGPSPRNMDALPIQLENGRLRLTWLRFQAGIATQQVI